MERQYVMSTNIQSIGYNVEDQILEIEFKNGGVYQYHGVPELEYENIMMAGSHGTYFNEHIRNTYPHLRF